MDVRTSFAETALAPQQHEFDQDTLQDVSLACVEGDASAFITLPNMNDFVSFPRKRCINVHFRHRQRTRRQRHQARQAHF